MATRDASKIQLVPGGNGYESRLTTCDQITENTLITGGKGAEIKMVKLELQSEPEEANLAWKLAFY